MVDALGTNSGTLQINNSGNDGAGSTGGVNNQGSSESPLDVLVSGTVVANRVVTSSSAGFGLVHVGQAVTPQTITLSTTGDDNRYTRVTVTNSGIDNNGFLTVSGGSTGTVFNSSTSTDTRVVSGTASVAVALSGTITLTTSGECLANESPFPVSVNYTAQVFSGSGRWTGTNGATSWGSGASGNWTDANGQGVQAAPGTFSGYNDTAVLDNTGGTNTTITLDGASPTLAALIFNTTGSGSYTLGQGAVGAGSLNLNNGANAAAVVTVLGGTHTITAPITLTSSGSFAPTVGTQLTLAGNISNGPSGSMSLALADSGTLILSGTDNSYSGGTYVDAGTLITTNDAAVPDGTSLTVGAGGVFLFDPTATFAMSDLTPAVSARVAVAVPEPATLALLGAARRWPPCIESDGAGEPWKRNAHAGDRERGDEAKQHAGQKGTSSSRFMA